MASNKWTEFVSKNLFTSKDEFHELPYLSNSPLIKINSIADISIAEQNLDLQYIATNNPFCKGAISYRNIEEGLWLLSTTITFKQNILAKALYDSNELSDYFFLSYSIFEYDFPSINGSNQSNKLLSKCWTFYKPKTEVATYFYKKTSGNFCNIVFSKKWVEQNLTTYCGANATAVLKFLNSETGFLSCLDIVPQMTKFANIIDSIIKKDIDKKIDVTPLREPIYKLIANFFEVMVAQKHIQNYKPLKNEDYANVAKAEKEILKNLSKPFIGVDQIAETVNLSATKLKSAFKMIHGLSMLQYHKQKNLQLAEQLVINSEIPIKFIANITGYESPSKFTAAFKKNFGVLPSKFRESTAL